MPGRTVASACVLLALLAIASGCSGGSGAGKPQASPITTEGTSDAMATATVPATAGPDIRTLDLPAQPGLQSFLAGSGGAVDSNSIVYADLTEDGVEDAVVPVSSGGEGGDIAVFVYGYTGTGLEELLSFAVQKGSLAQTVENGVLTIQEPVYSDQDPLCCPSDFKTTAYRWDGTELVPEGRPQPSEGN